MIWEPHPPQMKWKVWLAQGSPTRRLGYAGLPQLLCQQLGLSRWHYLVGAPVGQAWISS